MTSSRLGLWVLNTVFTNKPAKNISLFVECQCHIDISLPSLSSGARCSPENSFFILNNFKFSLCSFRQRWWKNPLSGTSTSHMEHRIVLFLSGLGADTDFFNQFWCLERKETLIVLFIYLKNSKNSKITKIPVDRASKPNVFFPPLKQKGNISNRIY